jgi:hypothetical protein
LYADYIGDDGPFLKMSKNWRLEGGDTYRRRIHDKPHALGGTSSW